MGITGPKAKFNHVLAPFPKRKQDNGRAMPHWNDLTLWLKVQLAVMLMDEWSFQTFSIHIHPDLESKWVSEGRDVRAQVRYRLRKELASIRPHLEHFFSVEGWSKLTKAPTRLHIHGAALIDPGENGERIVDAAMRAAGQGQRGRPVTHRARHGALFTRAGPRYANYLLKSVRKADPRLVEKRFTMSRSIIDAIAQTGEGLCIAARTVDHAAEVFVCFWIARTGGAPGEFAIGRGAPPAYRGHDTVDAVERGYVAGVLVLRTDEMVTFEPAIGA